MKFIKVQSHIRPGEAPSDLILNVAHIVSFFQRHFNDGVPYVYLDTTRQSGLHIAGTVDELVAKIESIARLPQSGLVKEFCFDGGTSNR